MFNDDAGFELVNLQAQRDLNSLVKNDERRHVNRDRTTTIDKDETVTVHGKRTEIVDLDEHITIHQNRTETVDKDETITIHQNRQERVDENETLDIRGNRTETVHKSEQILIKGNRDKTVKGNDTLNVKKDRKENIDKSRSLTVDRTNTEFVKLGKSVTVGLGYVTQVGTVMNTAVGIMQTEQVGRIKKSFVGKSYSITAGDEFKVTVGKSSLIMNADGSIIITGSSIVTQAEKENKVIGKDVLINPPGGGASTSSQAEEPSSGASLDASKLSGVVGGGFGGGLKGQPAQRGPDGLIIQGSDSDEMTDEELYSLNDQMIEEAIASGGMVAGSKYGNLQTEQFMNRQAGNINSSVMNNNGYTGNGMPAYQQQQNQKTADAVMTAASMIPLGRVGQTVHKGSNAWKAARATKAANLKLLNAINKERALAKKAGWKKPNGDDWWPDNKKGYDKVPGTLTTHTYKKGQGFNRYSDRPPIEDTGAYVSPKGTTFGQRAMKGKESDYTERHFEILKDFTDLPPANRSKATPWFDQPGMGNQDQLPLPIKDLIEKGYIKHLE